MTLKMQPTEASVEKFLYSIDDPKKKEDCLTLCEMMEKITNTTAVMWGDSIVGFGSYHYKYQSGREGDWFLTGFSPRKKNISIYIMNGFDHYENYLQQLGKVKSSVSCLYLRALEDVDAVVLRNLIVDSVNAVKSQYS